MICPLKIEFILEKKDKRKGKWQNKSLHFFPHSQDNKCRPYPFTPHREIIGHIFISVNINRGHVDKVDQWITGK